MPRPNPEAYAANMTTDPFCRGLQMRFDVAHFDRRAWFDLTDPLIEDVAHTTDRDIGDVWYETEKSRHVMWHILKAVGKLSRYAVGDDERMAKGQAFPDYLMYRTQLANTNRFDLEKQLGTFTTHESRPETAIELGRQAVEMAAPYFERIEHGEYKPHLREVVRTDVVAALHEGGMVLANHFDMDPHESHARHLQYLTGQPGLL